MIELKNISKTYTTKKGLNVKALDDVSIKFEETGMVFILGKSGSGKSTMLNLLGGLDKYDSGEIIVKGKSSKDFSQSEFDSYRNTYLGFIFQEYNILPEFTVGANIALAMELQGKKATDEELNKLLEEVDLGGYAGRKPNELSGGQKQRVAIARALIKNPDIILADEPTGALDSKTGKQVFETLQKLSKTKLVIIVSHDREFAEYYGDRVIELSDGKVISDIKKFDSQGKSISEGLNVIDDKIIHIKKGYHLTAEDLKLINDYVSKNDDDTIISCDKATNTDLKKFARLDDSGNRIAFKDTNSTELTFAEYTPSDFKLIKSKLPIKNMFKIGASSLRVKPFRLFVTILLSAIALTFFGVADTLAAYDKTTTIVSSIIDNKLNYVSLSKSEVKKIQDWEIIRNENMNDEDIEYLEKQTNLNYIPIKSISSNYEKLSPNGFVNNDKLLDANRYFKQLVGGVAEVQLSNLGELGFKLVGNSAFPSTTNEVLITKYIYQHFELAGWKNPLDETDVAEIKTENDIIGKTIEINKQIFTVSGVVETNMDYEHFKSLKAKEENNVGGLNLGEYLLSSELTASVTTGPHALIFVKSGFEADNPQFFLTADYSATQDLQCSYESNNEDDFDNYIYYTQLRKAEKLTSVNYCDGYSADSLGNDDIIIETITAVSIYNRIPGVTPIDRYTPQGEIESILKAISLPQLIMASRDWSEPAPKYYRFNIAGFTGNFLDQLSSESSNIIYLSKANVAYLEGAVAEVKPYKTALASMPERRSEITDLVKFSYTTTNGVTYKINDSTVLLLDNTSNLIEMLSKVFMYIGLGFAVFASFLMMNFIATSISYKKHEIGILRAVGARSRDVFGIFFAESLIIAGIEWIVAIILTICGTAAGNYAIRTNTGFGLTLLTVGIRQVGLVLAISVFVAFIASLIPIWRIARKKPIDSINNR